MRCSRRNLIVFSIVCAGRRPSTTLGISVGRVKDELGFTPLSSLSGRRVRDRSSCSGIRETLCERIRAISVKRRAREKSYSRDERISPGKNPSRVGLINSEWIILRRHCVTYGRRPQRSRLRTFFAIFCCVMSQRVITLDTLSREFSSVFS